MNLPIVFSPASILWLNAFAFSAGLIISFDSNFLRVPQQDFQSRRTHVL